MLHEQWQNPGWLVLLRAAQRLGGFAKPRDPGAVGICAAKPEVN
jgi:hypothetical protein